MYSRTGIPYPTTSYKSSCIPHYVLRPTPSYHNYAPLPLCTCSVGRWRPTLDCSLSYSYHTTYYTSYTGLFSHPTLSYVIQVLRPTSSSYTTLDCSAIIVPCHTSTTLTHHYVPCPTPNLSHPTIGQMFVVGWGRTGYNNLRQEHHTSYTSYTCSAILHLFSHPTLVH